MADVFLPTVLRAAVRTETRDIDMYAAHGPLVSSQLSVELAIFGTTIA